MVFMVIEGNTWKNIEKHLQSFTQPRMPSGLDEIYERLPAVWAAQLGPRSGQHS